jgi:hypothetical protein
MPTAVSETENSRPFLMITRYALYVILIFSPLAVASVQEWAITTIHILSLIALTSFLFEKTFTWDWHWIKTPLDKPIVCLLILSFLATSFSMNRPTSFWAIVLFTNYVVIFYLLIHTVRTRADFRRLLWLIICIGAFLSLFGLFKKYMGNPFPWWNYGNIPEKGGQLISTYGNRNHLAGYLEMAPTSPGFRPHADGLQGCKAFYFGSIIFPLSVCSFACHVKGGMDFRVLGSSVYGAGPPLLPPF